MSSYKIIKCCTFLSPKSLNIKFIIGILVSFITSMSIVLSSIIFTDNRLIAIFSVIIFPLLISFIFTQNIVDALTVIWINEIFFGIGGDWIKVGPFPGRGLLMIIILFYYVLIKYKHISSFTLLKKRNVIIFYYGLILPIFLFVYSIFIKESNYIMAMSDVMRLTGLLMYFPVRDLIKRNFDLFFGWIIGASIIIALLNLALSIAPENIRTLLNLRWLKESIFYSYTFVDINRPVSTITIFCFLGVFIGLLYSIDVTQNKIINIAGVFFTGVSLAVFVMTYLRGPIFSISLIIIMCVFILLTKREYKISAKIFIMIILFILTGYLFTIKYHYMATLKWSFFDKNIEEIIDPVRIEQTKKMLEAWLEEPFFGMGVGVPVPGYLRSPREVGLYYEVQYPMILYKVGIIGFLIITFPFIIIFKKIVVFLLIKKITKLKNVDKLFLGVGFSFLSLLITSWFNPYLSSVMTPLFIVLFLSTEDKFKINNDVF